MRVIGQDKLAAVIRTGPNLPQADAARAWLYEMLHRRWDNIDALACAFADVDLSEAPRAVFHLSSAPLSIETLFDLFNDVVLIIAISVAHAPHHEHEAVRDRPLCQ